MVFKRPTCPGPSLAPRDYPGPRSGKATVATLIEAPHPQEVNYLAGKEAPNSVLINYLWRCNYSEYGIRDGGGRGGGGGGGVQKKWGSQFQTYCISPMEYIIPLEIYISLLEYEYPTVIFLFCGILTQTATHSILVRP